MTCFRTIALALALSFGAVAAMPIAAAEAAPRAQPKKVAKPARGQAAQQSSQPIAAQPSQRDGGGGASGGGGY